MTDTPDPQPTRYLTKDEQKIMAKALRRSMRIIDGPDPQPTLDAIEAALDYLDYPNEPWAAMRDALSSKEYQRVICLAATLDRFAAQHPDHERIAAMLTQHSTTAPSVPAEATDAMKRAYWDLLGPEGDGPHPSVAWRTMLAAAPAPVSGDAREEIAEEALQHIVQWSEAYPLDIFPEPDFAKAHELLKAGGITLDAISASCMRRVVEGVGKIAREALKGIAAPVSGDAQERATRLRAVLSDMVNCTVPTACQWENQDGGGVWCRGCGSGFEAKMVSMALRVVAAEDKARQNPVSGDAREVASVKAMLSAALRLAVEAEMVCDLWGGNSVAALRAALSAFQDAYDAWATPEKIDDD